MRNVYKYSVITRSNSHKYQELSQVQPWIPYPYALSALLPRKISDLPFRSIGIGLTPLVIISTGLSGLQFQQMLQIVLQSTLPNNGPEVSFLLIPSR